MPGDMMVDGRIQSHVVRFNEILTEVILPAPKPGVRASFEKLRPRGVWDFAMASLAMSLQLRDNTIEDARVVFGGIAGKPLRETRGGELSQGQDAERGPERSGRCDCAGECGAAQIQLDQDRHGQGPAGFRSGEAECDARQH